MIHAFYTPVEISRQPSVTYCSKDLQKIGDDLFGITVAKIESISDRHLKIVQWLKRISQVERQIVTTFTNKQFVCLARKMYQMGLNNDKSYKSTIRKDSQQHFYLQTSLRPMKVQHRQVQQTLLDEIVVYSNYTYCDSIGFSNNLLNDVDKLYRLFDVLQDGISQELTHEDFHHYQKDDSEALFYDSSEEGTIYRGLGLWIADVLSRHISLNYMRSQETRGKADELRNRFKEYTKEWQIVQSQRMKIISKTTREPIVSLIQHHSDIVRVQRTYFPATYIDENMEMRNKQQIFHSDPKGIYMALRRMRLQDSFQSFNYYLLEIADEIESRIVARQQAQEMNKHKIVLKKKNKRVVFNQKEPIVVVKQIQAKGRNEERGTIQRVTVRKEQIVSVEIRREDKFGQMQKEDQMPISPKKPRISFTLGSQVSNEKVKIETPNRNRQKQEDTSPKDASQGNIQKGKPAQVKMPRNRPALRPPSQKEASLMSQAQIQNQSLVQIYRRIQQQAKRASGFRRVTMNRIVYTLRRMNISCQIYGSSACGLTLKDSDIDILVCPAIVNIFCYEVCSYKEKIVKSLQLLQRTFEQTSWASGFVLLPQAMIPLLTFKAQPSVPFEHQNCRMKLNLGKKHQGQDMEILVDISIQPYEHMTHEVSPHLGLRATQLMRHWIATYPNLHGVVTICKQLLRSHNLNKTYNGGMGSFTLMVFAAAYFQQISTGQRLVFRQALLGFVTFMQSLNDTRSVIDLSLSHPIVQMPEEKGHKKMIVVNPLNHRNLMDMCSKFGEIRALLGLLHTLHKEELVELIFKTE